MTANPANQVNLIDEIDIRQNQVLDQLDELNARVEALLKSCSPTSASGGPVD